MKLRVAFLSEKLLAVRLKEPNSEAARIVELGGVRLNPIIGGRGREISGNVGSD